MKKYRRRRKKSSFLSTLIVLIVIFWFLGEVAPKIFQETSENVGFSTHIVGKTYYVSTDGADSSDGSAVNPFKTITRGIEQLEPGDGIIIKEGVYYEKITLSKKGSFEKPFFLKTEGEVVLDGKGKGGTLVTIEKGASYWSIEGLKIRNLFGVEARGMCLKASCNHIQVLDVFFENIQTPHPSHKYNTANAVYFDGGGETEKTAIDNILIKGGSAINICAGWSEVYSVDGNCTNITLDGINISFPDIKGNIGICVCGHDPNTNDNPEVNRPRHVTVKNCNIKGCRSPYGHDAYGVYMDGAYDVTVYGNIVSDSEGGIEVGAEHATETFKGRDTEKVLVEGNTIINCKNAVYVGGFNSTSCGYAYDVTVTGNTFENSGRVTIDQCRKVYWSNNKGSEVKRTHRAEEVTEE